ncbi:hypothetical protein M9Y10_009691 [Tritrichomonas musculus]|uniref:Uncharacterized protein n=1 Tax=Tritrichomonas musculus TaxID=1915356 RepID=A0ABR2IQF1_9EUKA
MSKGQKKNSENFQLVFNFYYQKLYKKMGRRGLKAHILKRIIVSINNIKTIIPVNKNELIEDKEALTRALRDSALEFRKILPKIKEEQKEKNSKLSKSQNLSIFAKIDNASNVELGSISNLKVLDKNNTDLLTVPHIINTKICYNNNLQESLFLNVVQNKLSESENTLNEQYELRIISDWDRLWEKNNNSYDGELKNISNSLTNTSNYVNTNSYINHILHFPIIG